MGIFPRMYGILFHDQPRNIDSEEGGNFLLSDR